MKYTHEFPAMILAAGRGERMRPLTDHLPKPLLEVRGKSLLAYHLEGLSHAGFKHIVINHAWLGHKIIEQLGDGSSFDLAIHYSAEQEALETAGGIANAQTLLEPHDYFFVINGDTFVPDFPFDKVPYLIDQFRERAVNDGGQVLAYLFLVPNPPQHPLGDFYLNEPYVLSDDQLANNALSQKKWTFSGAAIYHKNLFENIPLNHKAPLAPLLKKSMSLLAVEGEVLKCPWHDVGTPDRLLALNQLSI